MANSSAHCATDCSRRAQATSARRRPSGVCSSSTHVGLTTTRTPPSRMARPTGMLARAGTVPRTSVARLTASGKSQCPSTAVSRRCTEVASSGLTAAPSLFPTYVLLHSHAGEPCGTQAETHPLLWGICRRVFVRLAPVTHRETVDVARAVRKVQADLAANLHIQIGIVLVHHGDRRVGVGLQVAELHPPLRRVHQNFLAIQHEPDRRDLRPAFRADRGQRGEIRLLQELLNIFGQLHSASPPASYAGAASSYSGSLRLPSPIGREPARAGSSARLPGTRPPRPPPMPLEPDCHARSSSPRPVSPWGNWSRVLPAERPSSPSRPPLIALWIWCARQRRSLDSRWSTPSIPTGSPDRRPRHSRSATRWAGRH